MKQKTLNIIIITICLGILLFASFFDMEVSNALYNNTSLFGQFFKDFGEIPAFILMTIAITIIVFKSEKGQKKPVKIVLRIIIMLFNAFLMSKFVKIDNDLFKFAISGIASALITYVTYRFLSKSDEETLKALVKTATVVIIIILFTNIAVQLLKNIFGRVRYRDLVDDYTPWYVITISSSEQSFPSGHTIAAANLFCVVLFFNDLKINKGLRMLICALSIFFVALTGVARIILGAHYLSDVIVSIMIGYLAIIIVQIKKSNKPKKSLRI